MSTWLSAALAATLAAAPTEEVETFEYTIQKGDSLWKIASQFYPDNVPGGIEKIKEANPEKASNPQNLKLGDVLNIP